MNSKLGHVALGIFPSTRGYGYALFENPKEVIDAGVASIKPMSHAKCIKRIEKVLSYYHPAIIILRSDHASSRCSKRQRVLMQKIEGLAKELGIKIFKVSRKQIQYSFEQFGAKTKYEVAKQIAEWLPQYASRVPKIRKPWMAEAYNMVLFDALALVYAHYYLND